MEELTDVTAEFAKKRKNKMVIYETYLSMDA